MEEGSLRGRFINGGGVCRGAIEIPPACTPGWCRTTPGSWAGRPRDQTLKHWNRFSRDPRPFHRLPIITAAVFSPRVSLRSFLGETELLSGFVHKFCIVNLLWIWKKQCALEIEDGRWDSFYIEEGPTPSPGHFLRKSSPTSKTKTLSSNLHPEGGAENQSVNAEGNNNSNKESVSNRQLWWKTGSKLPMSPP